MMAKIYLAQKNLRISPSSLLMVLTTLLSKLDTLKPSKYLKDGKVRKPETPPGMQNKMCGDIYAMIRT